MTAMEIADEIALLMEREDDPERRAYLLAARALVMLAQAGNRRLLADDP